MLQHCASMSWASVTPGASSCSLVKTASLVRTALITGSPVVAISATSVARSGGFWAQIQLQSTEFSV